MLVELPRVSDGAVDPRLLGWTTGVAGVLAVLLAGSLESVELEEATVFEADGGAELCATVAWLDEDSVGATLVYDGGIDGVTTGSTVDPTELAGGGGVYTVACDVGSSGVGYASLVGGNADRTLDEGDDTATTELLEGRNEVPMSALVDELVDVVSTDVLASAIKSFKRISLIAVRAPSKDTAFSTLPYNKQLSPNTVNATHAGVASHDFTHSEKSDSDATSWRFVIRYGAALSGVPETAVSS